MNEEIECVTYWMRFSKTGPIRFISHLDLTRAFHRAFFRAGIRMKTSSGFTPHPKFAFALPLSVGMESLTEYAVFTLAEGVDLSPDQVKERLAGQLPKGVEGVPGSRMDCLIEGNLFVSPAGDLRCLMRTDADDIDVFRPRAAVLKVNTEDPDAAPELMGYVPMPCGYNSKFMMRFDEVSGQYIAIGNLPNSPKQPQHRNILALFASPDAEHWTTVTRLIDGEHEQLFEVGFQYPSFVFDGDDILLQVRTATNGSHNFHDANYSVFHVIPRFRGLLAQSAPQTSNKEAIQ